MLPLPAWPLEPPIPARAALAALLLLCSAVSAGGAPPSDPPPFPVPGPDPILEALSKRAARPLPPGATARMTLEVLEVLPGSGARLLGRFSAPLDPDRRALLERRLVLSARGGTEPATLGLEVSIRSRLLGAARAVFEVESRVRAGSGTGEAFVRGVREELEAGRSALFEAFQVPGTTRRLLLALSWHVVPPDALAEAGRALRAPPSAPMVDLLLELVRVEKGAERTLRRQHLSAGLGSEVRSLMRLVADPLGGGEEQRLEVRLRPRSFEGERLLLGIAIEGSLDASEGAPALWIDHRADTRIGPGRRYSLDLGGEPGSDVTYRLDILPRY